MSVRRLAHRAGFALAAVLGVVLLAGCPASTEESRSEGERAASAEDGPGPGFRLVERAQEAGLDFRHHDGSTGDYSIVEILASGVGLVDYDLDGDLDVYLLSGHPLPEPPEGEPRGRNRLFRNEGDLRFTDVTDAAGVPGVSFSVGCCAGDYDGDGDLDLYVAGWRRNVLYENRGDGTFRDVTEEAGVDDRRLSAGCVFVDYDRDGDLDLYVANYCDPALETSEPCTNQGVPMYCAPESFDPVKDSLFRNRGDGTFEDVSEAAGIAEVARWGMGVLITDYDEDGWVDIYVANDVSDNFLFRNLGDGRFENVALGLGAALSANGDEQGSMGVAAGDFDRDGRFDIVVTNYQKQLNALYHHQGPAGFSDLAMVRGLGETCLPLVSWGTDLVDLDLDGWPDLFIANGHLQDRISEFDRSSTYLQRNQVFLNRGSRFEDVTDRAGPALEERLSSRGAAFGDLDRDGDLDIVVSNSRDRPSLLVSEGPPRRSWVALELRGRRNVFAIGARVTLEAGGLEQVAEVRSGGSYASQNGLRLHFGLGDADTVDRVTVRWPEGETSVHEDLPARRVHRIEEPGGD